MLSLHTSGASARRALDRRLTPLRELEETVARPARGWLRAIREALGMTAAELAARTGVTESAVARLEKSELNDAARLGTLRRTADALGCDLVYAVVPRQPLQVIVTEQARRVAAREIAGVEQTMHLENQGLDPQTLPERIGENAQQIADQPGLWRA